jgi:tetratricopeptide (TPR) repeat protein
MELTIDQALQKAVEAHKVGKLQDAEALYRAILQAQPNHPDANHNLGVMAVSLSKTEAALPLFKIALEANQSQGQFWLSYIDALIKENQFDNAKNVLEQGKKSGLLREKVAALEAQLTASLLAQSSETSANKISNLTQQDKKYSTKKEKKKNVSRDLTKPNQIKSPPQIEINSLLEHYKNGRYDLAQNLATALTQQYPRHPFCWKVLGAVFKQTGKLQDSLIANQKVLELSPDDAEAYSNLGVTLKDLGRLEDAAKSYQNAIEIKPEYAEANSNLGNTLKDLGRLEEAEISYKKAIAIKPDFAEAHSNLGITLQELGRLEDAEVSHNKAIAIKPDYADAHYNLGITLNELGKLEEAETSYKKAIAIKPDFAQAYSNLGITLNELGRLEDAETSHKKAIAIKPDYAETHNNLGAILNELGRLEEAETSYKKAIAIKPDYVDAHYNLGKTLQDLGRLEDAETSYKKAIAIKPDYAEAHSNLGVTLQDLGRLEDAETSYKKAIAIKPDYAETYIYLGVMLQEHGRLKEAEENYSQAIRLKPDFIKAHNEMLHCLYLMDKKSLLFDQLDYLIKQNKANSVVGSLTCRSALRYGEEKLNIFCNEPLEHVLHVDLKSRYNFEEIFVLNARAILNEEKRSHRKQDLLSNGYQTSGNLFNIGNDFTDQMQKAIRLEIERYRTNFESSEEGLIRKWPAEYRLYGWLISMKSGGELQPHIHDVGWLSGSIYINVPPNLKNDSGKLVVALGKDSDVTNSRQNSKKVIDVVTGSMALFPASLMHHTIPFESEEERIVLAFDVVPKIDK